MIFVFRHIYRNFLLENFNYKSRIAVCISRMNDTVTIMYSYVNKHDFMQFRFYV